MHLIRKSLLLVQLPLILNTSYTVAMGVGFGRDSNSLHIAQERLPFTHSLFQERMPLPPPFERARFALASTSYYDHEPAKMTPFGHEPAKMNPYTSSASSHSASDVSSISSTYDEASAAGSDFDSDAGSLDLGIGNSYEYNPCPQEKEFYRQNSYTIFRRHAYNCARFYMCNFGLPVEFSCPAGQLWDQELTVCNFASAVDCGARKRSVSVNSV